jgi:hypothetical protein
VDAALGLGLGHALDAVSAALPLQSRIGAAAVDLEDDLFDAPQVGLAGVEDLDFPALQLGVLHVHAHQVGRPQVRLLAALGAADLQDHVARVIRIARSQKLLELAERALELRLDRLDLVTRERLEICIGAIAQQRFGFVDSRSQLTVAVVALQHPRQLGLLTAQLGGASDVFERRRVGQLARQLVGARARVLEALERRLSQPRHSHLRGAVPGHPALRAADRRPRAGPSP